MHFHSSHPLPQTFAALLVLVTMGPTEPVAAQSSVIYFHSDEERHLFRPHCFDFMPDDRYLLLAGTRMRGEQQAELRIWDFENERFILEHWIATTEEISAIDVAPDSETMLVASQTTEKRPDWYEGVALWRLQAQPGRDENALLRSSVEPIRQLQNLNNHGLAPAEEFATIMGQAILSEDASRIAVRRQDGGGPGTPEGGTISILIFNQSGRLLNTLEMPFDVVFPAPGQPGGLGTYGSRAMQFSPDGSQLATTIVTHHWSEPDSIALSLELAIWDVEDGELVDSATVIDHDNTGLDERHVAEAIGYDFRQLDYSPDGSRIACDGPAYSVNVVNAASLEIEWQLEGLTTWMKAVAFSPDGSLVAAISRDKGNLCLWNTSTGELVFRNENPEIDTEFSMLQWSSNGSRLVTLGSRWSEGTEIRTWDVEQMRN
jgi:WD40 repeat protein